MNLAMPPTGPTDQSPRLIIHAGTHKTASTYIQERLRCNQTELAKLGIHYQDPEQCRPKAKKLAAALCKRQWHKWERLFNEHRGNDILLSAEQFSVPLTDETTIQKLEDLAKKHHYELIIVLFIRSQLDYINSRYIYSLRRFYHHQSFEDFVENALNGKLEGEKTQRGVITRRSDVFDFGTYFKPLLRARSRGSRIDFLPFKKNNQDPFLAFVEHLGLDPSLTWRPCRNQRHLNRSPGIRGVWLARLLSQQLANAGITPKQIANSSQLVLLEEQRQRWNDPAFWGYNRKLARKVSKHFERNNQRFAKKAWGTRWEEQFPNDVKALERQRSRYRPQSIEEEERMHRISQRLLKRIQNRIRPKSFDIHQTIKSWRSVRLKSF